jgi:uncharacterized protein (DUF58 family)
MMSAALEAMRMRFADWLSARHGVAPGQAVLVQRRIYILPTRFGYLFGATLLIIFLGAINYSNSMAFVLTFLLVGMCANSLWLTHRNLVDLEMRLRPADQVFAGQVARFPIELRNPLRRARYSIGVQWDDNAPVYLDVEAGSQTLGLLPILSARRGRLQPGRLLVFTRFPLGLFHAWSWVTFDTTTLVYPKPAEAPAIRSGVTPKDGEALLQSGTGDDFAGLRAYRPGESLGQVAWKAFAREQGLLTKQFAGYGREEIWLDWNDFPNERTELRLSRLCRQVLDAEAGELLYGLRLPGIEIEPASSAGHRQHCLEALALFDSGDAP